MLGISAEAIAWLFGAFALLALALAAVDLYSVVSYSVAQRTNEFGIRIALGARSGHVLKIAFSPVVASVGSGIVAGVVLTLALNKVLARWVEGTSHDPTVLLAVTVLLSLVTAIACSAPAKRAAGVDPMLACATSDLLVVALTDRVGADAFVRSAPRPRA